MIGLIGGTGLDDWDAITERRPVSAITPWGTPSGPLVRGELDGCPVCFLARHGEGHRIPPHRINYRANIQALHDAGIRHLIAVCAVGSMDPAMPPGTIGVPADLIDYTCGRAHTYSDDAEHPLQHVEFTEPFDAGMRRLLLEAAQVAAVPCVDGGVLGVTQGPRLETAAEIRRMMADGCSLVGMTAMPEAALAAELGMRYAVLAVSVNWAAGFGGGAIHEAIERSISEGMDCAKRVIRTAVALASRRRMD